MKLSSPVHENKKSDLVVQVTLTKGHLVGLIKGRKLLLKLEVESSEELSLPEMSDARPMSFAEAVKWGAMRQKTVGLCHEVGCLWVCFPRWVYGSRMSVLRRSL